MQYLDSSNCNKNVGPKDDPNLLRYNLFIV